VDGFKSQEPVDGFGSQEPVNGFRSQEPVDGFKSQELVNGFRIQEPVDWGRFLKHGLHSAREYHSRSSNLFNQVPILRSWASTPEV
jgi:hypothetical protein